MITFRTTGDIQIDTKPAETAYQKIQENAMSGWLTIPTPETNLEDIKLTAQKINADSDFLICIGIGGSYLGHRAIIEALGNNSKTKILYAGNSLSTKSLHKIINEIGDANFSLNVISKSGTTTEPAITFRILKQKLIEKYGEEEAANRIYATTDSKNGALKSEATKNGYKTFIISDNIGGRYSVLTPVGLLPLAVAGLNIDDFIHGANELFKNPEPAYQYAILRTLCAERGYDTEVLATFDPEMHYLTEWWKQLFGESEGKNHQGIFPASVIYTTDLHSLGQYIQEGRRNIFETFINFQSAEKGLIIPQSTENLDDLNYLAEKSLDYVNEKAYEATVDAHRAGGIPVFEIKVDNQPNEKSLGNLIAFFELSCAISATLQNVDPFNQPGVEAYKTAMFRLLGKPGYTN